MIGPSLRSIFVAWLWLGLVLPESGQAQDDQPGETRPYVLVPQSARRVKVGLNFEVKAPNVLADEWSVYISQIPELPGQAEVKTTLYPRGKSARELSDEARPILFAQIPSVGQQFRKDVKTRVEYEATLIERRLDRKEPTDPDPPAVAPPDARMRRLLTSNEHQFDYKTPRFKAWLEENKLRREPRENEIDFARKAFLAVRHGLKHDEGAEGEHLASKVVEAGQSDYAGLTAVFVAALRANAIPTRILAGRMILFNNQAIKGAWPHAKVEFFAPGVGWVPADPAGAIRSGRKTEGLEYFGNDSGEFLTIHLDTDIIVDTYFGPKTHEWLQTPAWWVIGGGNGNFDGSTTRVDVTVDFEMLELTEVITRLNSRTNASTKKAASKTSKKAR